MEETKHIFAEVRKERHTKHKAKEPNIDEEIKSGFSEIVLKWRYQRSEEVKGSRKRTP